MLSKSQQNDIMKCDRTAAELCSSVCLQSHNWFNGPTVTQLGQQLMTQQEASLLPHSSQVLCSAHLTFLRKPDSVLLSHTQLYIHTHYSDILLQEPTQTSAS